DSDGARFPAGRVPDGALQEARDQVVFLGQRRMLIGPDGAGAPVAEQPLFYDSKKGQITGVRMAMAAVGRQDESSFSLDLFAAAPQEHAARLVRDGLLEKGDKFLYRVYAEPAAEEGNGRATGVVATVRRRSLPLVPGRLADWLADARPTGPMDDQD